MINNNIITPKKEGSKTRETVPKKEVSKPKAKVPKKEGSKTKAKVPKKEGSKAKAKVPKKEGSKAKAKVPKKESKKPHQDGGYDPNKSLFQNFLNHIESTPHFDIKDITETLEIKADKNQNIITIIITGHGGKCYNKKSTGTPATILETETAGINFTTWTTIGDKDIIKLITNRDYPTLNTSYDSNYINNKQAVLENHFKIARNYINGTNEFFNPIKEISKGNGLLEKISSIYERNGVVLTKDNKITKDDKDNKILERFLQQVLELSHVEYKWANEGNLTIDKQKISILNLMLYPDKMNAYLTCINISYVDKNNKIKLITITLFDLFRFIIYSIAVNRDKTPPRITNQHNMEGRLSPHLTGLMEKGLQIEHIFKYIKKILYSLNLNNTDNIIDLHLHSCLSNIDQPRVNTYLKAPRPVLRTLPSFNRFSYNKTPRKTIYGEINEEASFVYQMMDAIEDFAINVFNFDSVSLGKEYVGINKSQKYSRNKPGRMGKKKRGKNPLKPKKGIGNNKSKVSLKRKPSPFSYVKYNRGTLRQNRSTVVPFNRNREFPDDFDIFKYLNQKYYEQSTRRIAGLVATDPRYKP